jgi:hypothetical protein
MEWVMQAVTILVQLLCVSTGGNGWIIYLCASTDQMCQVVSRHVYNISLLLHWVWWQMGLEYWHVTTIFSKLANYLFILPPRICYRHCKCILGIQLKNGEFKNQSYLSSMVKSVIMQAEDSQEWRHSVIVTALWR